MAKDKFKKIKCPKCGYEYLPAEVFFAETLLGKPEKIIRSAEGNIELYTGEEPSFQEEWICDKCNAALIIDVDLNITTQLNPCHDFSEDYESTVYTNRITLEEASLFEDD